MKPTRRKRLKQPPDWTGDRWTPAPPATRNPDGRERQQFDMPDYRTSLIVLVHPATGEALLKLATMKERP